MMTLGDIFGQDLAIRTLSAAFLAGRLPHGLIFAGPTGVGKATTARALGNVFLCDHPVCPGEGAPANDTAFALPCGQCPSCRLSAVNSHPDYHVITKELIRYHDKTGKSKGINLSIDVMQPELIEPANRTASVGSSKVFVVEQSDLMTTAAQNAILKTLEEPAGRTAIILLTDQPSVLLPTVRSRCQTLRFSRLSDQRVESELRARGISEESARDAAALSDGSLGLALRWIQDGVVSAARELQDMVGRISPGRPVDLAGWFKAASEAYAIKQVERDELSSKDQATREALALYLKFASDVFRHRLSETDDPVTLQSACASIDALARAERYLDANVSIPLVFQQLQMTIEARQQP